MTAASANGRTCLITGSSGFIGRWLRSALVAGGFRVKGFDCQPSGDGDEVVGDVLDPTTVRTACDGVDVVCHLIGLQSSRDHSWEDFQRLNVRSTELLLDEAVRCGVSHFVYFSTELVYGRQWVPRVTEESILRPAGFYGKSKGMAEELCRARAAQGLPMTILRPCNVMGPGRRRVVDELFDRLRRNAPIPLVGGGGKDCQIVDVRDVAEIVREIVAKRVVGTYNVGTLSSPTVREVYGRLIERAHSRSRLVTVPAWLFRAVAVVLDRIGLSPLTADQYQRLADPWIIDPSKLFAAVEYRPRYNELQSIVATYDAFVGDPR